VVSPLPRRATMDTTPCPCPRPLAAAASDKDVERITTAVTATETTVLVLNKKAHRKILQSESLRRIYEAFDQKVLKQRNLVKYCLLRKVPFLQNVTGEAFVNLSALFEYVYFDKKIIICEEVRASREKSTPSQVTNHRACGIYRARRGTPSTCCAAARRSSPRSRTTWRWCSRTWWRGPTSARSRW
jgi:hypothetical protein